MPRAVARQPRGHSWCRSQSRIAGARCTICILCANIGLPCGSANTHANGACAHSSLGSRPCTPAFRSSLSSGWQTRARSETRGASPRCELRDPPCRAGIHWLCLPRSQWAPTRSRSSMNRRFPSRTVLYLSLCGLLACAAGAAATSDEGDTLIVRTFTFDDIETRDRILLALMGSPETYERMSAAAIERVRTDLPFDRYVTSLDRALVETAEACR